MGVLRQCFGAPDWLEQRCNGLEKYGPYPFAEHSIEEKFTNMTNSALVLYYK